MGNRLVKVRDLGLPPCSANQVAPDASNTKGGKHDIVFGIEYAANWIQVVGSASSASILTLLVDSLFLSLAFGVLKKSAFVATACRTWARAAPSGKPP